MNSRESWALENADYEIEYRDGICFTELENDLKDMLACQLCCPRHQNKKPNVDDLKSMFNGAYPRCEKVELPYICHCPCRSNARVICENNVGEYEHLVSMINDAPFKIHVKNEFMNSGKDKKTEFYERELPYVIYHHGIMYNNEIDTDRYGYLVRHDDKIYDLIIHRGHKIHCCHGTDDDITWTLEEAAIIENEKIYTTFDDQERRVLRYVDFKVDQINKKNLGYFGSDHLDYRRELEQMLTCDSCCERHQMKKPCLADFDNSFDGEYENESGRQIDYDCECDCNCRSNARQLCRNNFSKYNIIKDLIREADFEIGSGIKSESGFDERKKPFYDHNMPYFIYDERDDSCCDIKGEVTKWEMLFDILIRIDDVVYDIQVCHSSYDEDYISGLGIHPISGENIATLNCYEDSLELIRAVIVE